MNAGCHAALDDLREGSTSADHRHHEPSFELFARQDRTSACTASHCLAELYAVTTGMPGKNRASPDEALLVLDDVRKRFCSVTLDDDEYFKLLEDVPGAGIVGGPIAARVRQP